MDEAQKHMSHQSVKDHFLHFLKQATILIGLLAVVAFGYEVRGREETTPPNQPAAGTVDALMFAARDNNVDLIKKLLAAGADVNGRNVRGSTPLMWAASAGSIDETFA